MNRNSSSGPLEEPMRQGLHLDQISSALQVSVENCSKEIINETSPFISALVVCSVPRLCLYNMYACYAAFNRGISTPLQTDPQHVSLEGISGLV